MDNLDWLNSLKNRGWHLGLERMHNLLEKLKPIWKFVKTLRQPPQLID